MPVIMITARPHQPEQGKAAGVDALMEKPLDLPLLLQTIRELLDEADQRRAGMVSLKQDSTRGESESRVWQ